MPVHDWSRVEAGIFHHFHHSWIEETARALNSGVLSDDYYAMAEQYTSQFGPDVVTLQGSNGARTEKGNSSEANGGGVLLAPPKVRLTSEAELDFYSQKQKAVAIHHVSGDPIVAMVEIVSPGNKSSQAALRTFVEKAAFLLRNKIHLLVVDLHPPTKRDPDGIHGAIWDLVGQEKYAVADEKPQTLVSYESDISIRAFVVRVSVGDTLTDMPLFLKPGAHVEVPLEATYQVAWKAVPRRWRAVLDRPA